jgi:hypothetical protein
MALFSTRLDGLGRRVAVGTFETEGGMSVLRAYLEPVVGPRVRLELHPTIQGARYTLRGLFDTRKAAESKLAELAADGLSVVGFEEPTPDGRTGYFVAARHDVEPTSRSPIPHDYAPAWQVTRFAVALFRNLTKNRAGHPPVRWYKGLDVRALYGRIQAFAGQRGSLVERGAWLLSELIVTHPFPNANHRTALDLVRYYFRLHDVQWPFELRGKGKDRLHRETKAFFIESKYLLQLLRHKALIRGGSSARLHSIANWA